MTELLATAGLQRWFECHNLADFLQHTGGEISQLNVPHHRAANAPTEQSVVHRKCLLT